MPEALSIITRDVRERVRRDGVDLIADRALAARYVRDGVQRYSERALGGREKLLSDEPSAVRQIIAALTGFGALQPFFDDPAVEEIWINAPDRVFIARNGVSELTAVTLTHHEVRDLVERMLQSSGRRVDLSSPFVDASLPDGSRLHVVIPDITHTAWAVNIRKFTKRIRALHELVEIGSLTRESAEFLRMCVLSGHNILVSGATQSGKTTMLNALLSAVRPTERVITLEETFELDVVVSDHVGLQCRQPSLEGTGDITLRRLIKESLRMRPDRIVVGEVREAESLDLLIALNSGLPGMSSIHANSAQDALAKLSILPLLAGRNIDSAFVIPTVAGCIDVVVHCELGRTGQRRVVEIVCPTGEVVGSVIVATTVFARSRSEGVSGDATSGDAASGYLAGGPITPGTLTATGNLPARLTKFTANGFDPAEVFVS